MALPGGQIVLIVDGVLVRDDGGVIANIHTNVQRLMDSGELLNQAISDFQESITTLISDVEDLLTQPSPDVDAAVTALGIMKGEVDTTAQRVRDAMAPEDPSLDAGEPNPS